MGESSTTITGINFRGNGPKMRFKVSPTGDLYQTRNHTIAAKLINHHFGIYSGGLASSLDPERINLNKITDKYGSILNYLGSEGKIDPKASPKIFGVLFSGGPAPSANAVIRAIEIKANYYGAKVFAFEDGVVGLLSGQGVFLTPQNVHGIQRLGGVVIGTERKNPDEKELDKIEADFKKWGLSGLILIGGDDTQSTALRLSARGIPIIGGPKTVDDDLPVTWKTFGAETVVNGSADDMADMVENDARPMNRYLIYDVMGRKSGSWTMHAGNAAGVTRTIIGEEFTKKGILELAEATSKYEMGKYEMGAQFVLRDVAEVVRIRGEQVPFEQFVERVRAAEDSDIILDPQALAAQLARMVRKRALEGLRYGSIAVAEGVADKLIEVTERDEKGNPKKGIIKSLNNIEVPYDEFGNPNLTGVKFPEKLAKMIKQHPDITSLDPSKKISDFKPFPIGYQFRGKNPLAYDINMSTSLGSAAMELALNGEFGRMVILEKNDDVGSIEFKNIPTHRRNETEHIIPRVVLLNTRFYLSAKEMEYFKQRKWDISGNSSNSSSGAGNNGKGK